MQNKPLHLLFVLALTLFGVPYFAEAAGVPISYKITSFPSSNFWEAYTTDLTPASDGRLETTSSGLLVHGGNCGDILTGFQKRTLDTMVEKKYITPEMRDALLDFQKLGIKPEQVVTFTLYSTVSTAEARRLFHGEPPPERTLTDAKTPEDFVNISRGTIFFVRGYEPVRLNENVKIVPWRVPWEIDTPPVGLTRNFDREKVPYLVEIGRVNMEKEGLAGDIGNALHVVMTYLQNETRTLQIKPEELVISAHFLDAQHTRLFSVTQPVRPLDSQLQAAIEDKPAETWATYLNRPLPKGEEWKRYQNTVVVGTLAEHLKKFPLEKISHSAARLGSITRGQIHGVEAVESLRDFNGLHREAVDFYHPQLPMVIKPLVVNDFGTALLKMKMHLLAQKHGWQGSVKDYEQLIEAANFSHGTTALPLALTTEKHVLLPASQSELRVASQRGQSVQPRRHMMISNFDREATLRFPMTYLTVVILAVADRLQHQIENLSPAGYILALNDLNRQRQEQGLAAVTTLTFDNFLEVFKIEVASTDSNLQKQARDLGGKEIDGVNLSFDFDMALDEDGASAKANANVQMLHFYVFGKSEIDRLREMSEAYIQSSRKNIQPQYLRVLERLQTAGTF